MNCLFSRRVSSRFIVMGMWTRLTENYTRITLLSNGKSPLKLQILGNFRVLEGTSLFKLVITWRSKANVYWTIVDLLDVFITSQSLDIKPDKLKIILIDAHPKTSLDPLWTFLFQRLIKLTDPIFIESNGVVFESLLWRYPRARSPLLDKSRNSLKYIQPFRSFVLRRFGILS